MNLDLAALLSLGQIAGAAGSSSTQSTNGTTGQTDAQKSLQFKMQFNQALSAITGSTSGSSATTTDPSGSLQSALQKKIADLLAGGTSVADIVKQLSASLATQLAQQFGGDAPSIQATLQSAFASALSPPGNGPPLTAASTASALAHRFRQVADLAARVSGETTGQSNRLFAGSNLDAVSTAGVQPAPSTNQTGTGLTADSIIGIATSALAGLTTPAPTLPPATVQTPGDGKTVALQGAPVTGTNGDTVLGRILARATLSANAAAARSTTTAPAPNPTTTDEASTLVTNAAASGAAPTNPALNAFLRSFSTALAQSDAKPDATKTAALSDSDLSALLGTTVTTMNPSTASAFMPVQSPFSIAAATPDPTQQIVTQQPYTTATVNPNDIADQLVRGVFLTNNGSSSDVSLKLVPESLGNVNVKLTIDGGNVSAQVIAQTSDARDALLAGQNQLTRSLADAGIKLTSFNVSLAGGFAGGFAQQQQQQQAFARNTSSGRNLLLGGVDTMENDDSSTPAVPSFMPSHLANMNWGAFNYLV